MRANLNPEVPTTDLFLPLVLERTGCGKHNVPHGVPCFHLPKLSNGYLAGVCNKRAKKAGFTAPISYMSVRAGKPKK